MPGPKYVKDFEFPSNFGFSGSATDRVTTPVKAYERGKPKFAEGGPVKDDTAKGYVTDKSGNTKVAQAPAPPKPKGDTVQIDPKGTVDTLRGGQRERQMKELGLKKGGKVKKGLGGFLKRLVKNPIANPMASKSVRKVMDPVSSRLLSRNKSAPAPAPSPVANRPVSAPRPGMRPMPMPVMGGPMMRSKGGKAKPKFAEGGYANNGIKTSGLNQGNATDQRSDPSNNMNQQTGGKTPLRQGFKAGGPLRRATGGPVTAARGGDVAQDRKMIKQAINKHVAAPKPRGHGVPGKMRGGAAY